MEKEIEIPEGYEARIEGNKVILEPKESEDERIRKFIVETIFRYYGDSQEYLDTIAYLKKQKEQETAMLNKEDDAVTKQFVLNQLFSLKGHIKSGRSWEYIPLIDGLIKTISESMTVITPNEELLSKKPTEWSEEDSIRVGTVSSIIYDYAFLKDALDENHDLTGDYAEIYNWFGTLPERFYLQPKQEWSEDDNRKIAELKSFIAQCNGFNKANRQKAFDMIDALRPQSHWKPSEEQIEALENVIKCELSAGMHTRAGILQTLQNDLKKL